MVKENVIGTERKMIADIKEIIWILWVLNAIKKWPFNHFWKIKLFDYLNLVERTYSCIMEYRKVLWRSGNNKRCASIFLRVLIIWVKCIFFSTNSYVLHYQVLFLFIIQVLIHFVIVFHFIVVCCHWENLKVCDHCINSPALQANVHFKKIFRRFMYYSFLQGWALLSTNLIILISPLEQFAWDHINASWLIFVFSHTWLERRAVL